MYFGHRNPILLIWPSVKYNLNKKDIAMNPLSVHAVYIKSPLALGERSGDSITISIFYSVGRVAAHESVNTSRLLQTPT